jgi:hypothetical protein
VAGVEEFLARDTAATEPREEPPELQQGGIRVPGCLGPVGPGVRAMGLGRRGQRKRHALNARLGHLQQQADDEDEHGDRPLVVGRAPKSCRSAAPTAGPTSS